MPLTKQTIYAGVDVGGTNIKLGLVDDKASTLAYESIPTLQEEGPAAAAARCAATIERLCIDAGLERSDLAAVGLATPGPMNTEAGVLHAPGNLPAWRDAPVRDMFAEATGRRVTLANDANAAAFGEFWAGAGGRYKSLVLITLGTGVGGGVVLNGPDGPWVLEGAHSAGGEIGHVVIDPSPDAPLNSLGVRGTLEGYCGSYGVRTQLDAILADAAVHSSLRDRLESGEPFTPKMISEEADAGDEVALRIVRQTAYYLAIGVVVNVHLIDPEAVVIGGALTFGGAGSSLGEHFLDEVRRHARERMFENLRDRVTIEFATLGGDAGYLGSAGLARIAAATAL